MGALRRGQLAVATKTASAGGATGMAMSAGQFGQQKVSRAIDTRPTLEVDEGSLGPVRLTKLLKLPEVAWYLVSTRSTTSIATVQNSSVARRRGEFTRHHRRVRQ
jgi:hypothetical protein